MIFGQHAILTLKGLQEEGQMLLTPQMTQSNTKNTWKFQSWIIHSKKIIHSDNLELSSFLAPSLLGGFASDKVVHSRMWVISCFLLNCQSTLLRKN